MNREQAKAEIKARYAEYLEPAKKRGTYICPLCGNGTGSTGDGLAVDPHGDRLHLKCFNPRCNFYGDLIELYQQQHGCTQQEAFSGLYSYFNISIDEYTAEPQRQPQRAQKAPQEVQYMQEVQKDYTEYYRECKARISDPAAAEYLALRGLSPELAHRFWIGFDPAWRSPAAIERGKNPPSSPRLIIPTSTSSYIARDTRPDVKDYAKMKEGEVQLFNTRDLYNADDRPVFITEGEIDALSIIEAGGLATALGSAANYKMLVDLLRDKRTNNTLILSLDNDDAGRKTSRELAAALQGLNISYISADIAAGYKDPNEALNADRTAFFDAVTAAESNAREQQPERPLGLLTLERAISIFEAVDDHYLEMPNFPQLSEMLKIKTHDTIVIAADTGAGKSSLALNFLHELQDRYPALYINLEMDEATILQRLVAIHTGIELDEIEGYKHDSNTRSKVNAAISEIVSRKDITLLADVYDLKEIEKQIQTVTQGRTEPTIVFVDTGLLVTTGNKSASRYERFTQISEELRRISRLNNIVMFVLLQQNRAGKQDENKEPTNSSLKESGSWENDATKIMFLWWNDASKGKELAITKNRSGKTGSIKLNYTAHTQTYKEVKDYFTPYYGKTPFDKPGRKW